MRVVGYEHRFRDVRGTSAFSPRATVEQTLLDFSKAPNSDVGKDIVGSRTTAVRHADDAVVDVVHACNVLRYPLGLGAQTPAAGHTSKSNPAIAGRYSHSGGRHCQADVVLECGIDLNLQQLVRERRTCRRLILKPRVFGKSANRLYARLD